MIFSTLKEPIRCSGRLDITHGLTIKTIKWTMRHHEVKRTEHGNTATTLDGPRGKSGRSDASQKSTSRARKLVQAAQGRQAGESGIRTTISIGVVRECLRRLVYERAASTDAHVQLVETLNGMIR